MAKQLRISEFLLAVEGLALARNVFSGSDQHTDARLAEIGAILEALAAPDALESRSVRTNELDVDAGYAQWASAYDEVTNPLVEVEEAALREVFRSIPPGNAVDLCCGTGRVTAILRDLGHRVRGFDGSAPMLAIARSKNPDIAYELRQVGDQDQTLPRDQDLVTCCLALTHFADLEAPMTDIAAMLRPGGIAVLSDLHPFFVTLDGQAFFNGPDETAPWIRNHVHHVGDYLRAFTASGLEVLDCREVVPNEGEGPMQSLVGMLRPEATRAAYLGIPNVLIWVLRKSDTHA